MSHQDPILKFPVFYFPCALSPIYMLQLTRWAKTEDRALLPLHAEPPDASSHGEAEEI